jgi:hypothetical protein
MKSALTGVIAGLLVAAAVPAAVADSSVSTKPGKARVAATEDVAAPATYDVFIDGVTGYAFIRTPSGWKFIRSLKEDGPVAGAALPEGVGKAASLIAANGQE